MKQINLIKTSITNTQVPKDFILDYRTEYLQMIERIPEGATASQMGIAIKIAAKLQDEKADVLHLEDAEWQYLKDKAVNHRFAIIAPEIVAMVEAVEQAQTVQEPLSALYSLADKQR